MDLIIDQEFKRFLPAPPDAGLEQRLIASGGPRETIKLWKGHNTVIDGHRRLEICDRLGLPYRTEEVDLPDRAAVLKWILREQLDRRNMGSHDAAVARARLRDLEEQALVDSPVKSAAEKAGVSTRTVIRDSKYAEALKKIGQVVPDAGEKIKAASKKDAIELAALPDSQIAEVVDSVERGEHNSIHSALKSDGDTVSPMLAQKPVKDEFAIISKALGGLKRQVDRLGQLFPGPHYSRVQSVLSNADDILEAWEKQERL
jgi:uncharacterized protein YajQ (UPF0234 family)